MRPPLGASGRMCSSGAVLCSTAVQGAIKSLSLTKRRTVLSLLCAGLLPRDAYVNTMPACLSVRPSVCLGILGQMLPWPELSRRLHLLSLFLSLIHI